MIPRFPARERLFADDYTASGQRAWLEGERGPEPGAGSQAFWRRNLLGQLRFDALISRALVVPDSYLIDGAFFLATPPERLTTELGRPDPTAVRDEAAFPVVFRMRAPTFAETLATCLVADGRPTLNGATFLSVADRAARDALAEELGSRPVEDLERRLRTAVSPAAAVADLLRSCLRERGHDDAAERDVGPLEEAWSRWIERDGALPIERYRTNEDFSPRDAMRDEPLDPLAERLTPAAAEALREIEDLLDRGTPNRSAVTGVLRRRRAAAADEETAASLDALDTWYWRVRHRAIAHQHGATFVQLLTGATPFGPLQRLCDRLVRAEAPAATKRVELPDDCLTGLADMPDDRWASYVAGQARRLEAWWRTGDIDHFKAVADALGGVLETDRTSQTLFGMVIPDALPVAAAGGEAAFIAHELGASPAFATFAGSIATFVAGTYQATGQPAKTMQRRMVDVARQTAGAAAGR